MEANALIAFSDDIATRTWKDWITAHTSFLEHLHRYKGDIRVGSGSLEFQGIDSKTGKPFMLTIPKYDIEQLYYGFDDCYTKFESRSLGIFWMPIRLTISSVEGIKFLYLIINDSEGKCDNKKWIEVFKNWLL